MLSENFTSNGEEFRLKRIKEIRDSIVKDKLKRENICKKLKRANLVTEVLDTGFVTVSIALSSGGVATLVFPPLATGLGVAAGVSGFLGIVTKFISKK